MSRVEPSAVGTQLSQGQPLPPHATRQRRPIATPVFEVRNGVVSGQDIVRRVPTSVMLKNRVDRLAKKQSPYAYPAHHPYPPLYPPPLVIIPKRLPPQSSQEMHRRVAACPRTQAKFWLLMDDLVDRYLLGIRHSYIGSHRGPCRINCKAVEDDYCSSGALRGAGAGLHPRPSQSLRNL